MLRVTLVMFVDCVESNTKLYIYISFVLKGLFFHQISSADRTRSPSAVSIAGELCSTHKCPRSDRRGDTEIIAREHVTYAAFTVTKHRLNLREDSEF